MWNPRPPARRPGRRHTPGLKTGTRSPPDDHRRQPSDPVKCQGQHRTALIAADPGLDRQSGVALAR
jgi:hypothetical protein